MLSLSASSNIASCVTSLSEAETRGQTDLCEPDLYSLIVSSFQAVNKVYTGWDKALV